MCANKKTQKSLVNLRNFTAGKKWERNRHELLFGRVLN